VSTVVSPYSIHRPPILATADEEEEAEGEDRRPPSSPRQAPPPKAAPTPSAPAGWRGIACRRSILSPSEHVVVSDTGQYERDWKKGLVTIRTPRTQAAWGFLGQVDRPLHLGEVELRIETPFAVVAVSSLTDEPIARSHRLLLTAVARAENTGMVYDLFHTRKLAAGHGPIVIEPVCGQVAISTSHTRLRVVGLDPFGRPSADLPTTTDGGRLTFEIGASAKTIHYLIEER